MSTQNQIVAAVQFAVGKLANVELAIDGIWGPESDRAFLLLARNLREDLREAVSYFGYDPGFLDAVKVSEVVHALREASRRIGEPYRFLSKVAEIESGLNPSAVNGSHRGLFQMSVSAWSDAHTYVKVRGLPVYEDYRSNVFDVDANALYGAAYLALTRARLKRSLDRDVTDVDVYLAHQQGVRGYTNLLAGRGVSEQNLLRNPPQDGRGITTDPVEFVRRWQEVVSDKLSQNVVV